MKYYIIAGETSGDLHGATLIKSLKRYDNAASFTIVGGDRMREASSEEPIIHTSSMSFMGFIEVLANIRTVAKNLRTVKRSVAEHQPDVLILIDFPGFNLKVADYAKKNGIKVYYYISPKIWAWNEKRVKKIKRVVDRMFCILPFEVEFYNKWGMVVDYVGNPLLDTIEAFVPNPNFRKENNLTDKPIVALLPGSRKMEISKILPLMTKVSRMFPIHQFVIAGAPNISEQEYRNHIDSEVIPIVFNSTYDLLNNAEAAIVTSGTATLETALFRVPQVVVYKANPISVSIARSVIKVRFISLVNLIMDMLAIRELIQKDARPDTVADELHLLINDAEYRANILENYDLLSQKIGAPGASERTAKLIVDYLKSTLS